MTLTLTLMLVPLPVLLYAAATRTEGLTHSLLLGGAAGGLLTGIPTLLYLLLTTPV